MLKQNIIKRLVIDVFIFIAYLFVTNVKQIYENYKLCRIKDIDIKLYKDGRHEILNELEYENVYNDIYNWIAGRIKITQKSF